MILIVQPKGGPGAVGWVVQVWTEHGATQRLPWARCWRCGRRSGIFHPGRERLSAAWNSGLDIFLRIPAPNLYVCMWAGRVEVSLPGQFSGLRNWTLGQEHPQTLEEVMPHGS